MGLTRPPTEAALQGPVPWRTVVDDHGALALYRRHVLRDARLSDLETELEQLAMDARRKDGVLGTHNTAEAISLRRTSELSLLFLRENHVPVIPISFRNGFLAFAPAIAGG